MSIDIETSLSLHAKNGNRMSRHEAIKVTNYGDKSDFVTLVIGDADYTVRTAELRAAIYAASQVRPDYLARRAGR